MKGVTYLDLFYLHSGVKSEIPKWNLLWCWETWSWPLDSQVMGQRRQLKFSSPGGIPPLLFELWQCIMEGCRKKTILLWHWIPHNFRSFSALNIVWLIFFALKIPPKGVVAGSPRKPVALFLIFIETEMYQYQNQQYLCHKQKPRWNFWLLEARWSEQLPMLMELDPHWSKS